MEIYKIMKNTLKLLTLCTAFNLWAPVAGEMNSVAINLNRAVNGMVKNRRDNSKSIDREERVPLVAQPNLSLELIAFANTVIKKKNWTPQDSIDMIKLLKPANEEFSKVGNHYLQEIKGIFILCDKQETARNITAIVTGVLAGGALVGGAYLYVQYKVLIDPVSTILLGTVGTLGVGGLIINEIKNKSENQGIFDWLISLIYRPAESLFPDQFQLADDLDNISFFRNYEQCKELYREFADMTIASHLKDLTEKLHKDSHRSLILSSQRGFNLLQNSSRRLNEQNVELQEQNVELQTENDTLITQLDSQNRKMNKLKRDNIQLKKNVQDLKEEFGQFKEQMEQNMEAQMRQMMQEMMANNNR
jgi:hypothetical protein